MSAKRFIPRLFDRELIKTHEVVFLATLVLFGAYTTVFSLTTELGFVTSALFAVVNTAPLVFWAWVAHQALKKWVLGLPVVYHLVGHVVFAVAFAVAWYACVIVVFGWMQGDAAAGFSVQHFQSVAFVWQMYQGVTLYAVVASASYALAAYDQLAATSDKEENARSHLLIKTRQDIVSMRLDDVVIVSGADDYAEIFDGKNTHLTRRTIAELEQLLPRSKFVRVHRSHLINLDAIDRVEPAGSGCLLVMLRGGREVKTSRAGARMLRSLAA